MAKILVLGSNFFNQLGNNDRTRSCWTPCLPKIEEASLTREDDIVEIQCANTFTACRTRRGNIVQWGYMNGRICLYPERVITRLPLRCLQLSCGSKHILSLMESGIVLSWGTGYFGQLGHGDDCPIDHPRVIDALHPQRIGKQVVSVECGGNHSGVLCATGEIFCWGLNRDRQCGVQIEIDTVMEPRLVCLDELDDDLNDHSGNETGPPEKPKRIVFGRCHSALLTNQGRVYVWGGSSFGRLGLVDLPTAESLPSPKSVRIPTLLPFCTDHVVIDLASGDFHMLALAHEGRSRTFCNVYAWGYGSEGQTGHRTTFHVKTPRIVDYFTRKEFLTSSVEAISCVCCGPNSSFAISACGKVYAWGYNDGGWLGVPVHQQESVEYSKLPILEPGMLVSSKLRHGSDDDNNTTSPNDNDDNANCKSPSFVSKQTRIKFSKSFDSRLNVLSPVLVTSLKPWSVFQLSAGSGHAAMLAYDAIPTVSSSAIDEEVIENGDTFEYSDNEDDEKMTPEDIDNFLSWCRHDRQDAILNKLSSSFIEISSIVDAESGNTPLIVAAQNGHDRLCKLLVEQYGASVNDKNVNGNTAMHFARSFGHDNVFNYLVGISGCNEYATNKGGLTCHEGIDDQKI